MSICIGVMAPDRPEIGIICNIWFLADNLGRCANFLVPA